MKEIKINGLKFVETCWAAPEQYDVFDENDNQVGYVRLRWGRLRCDYPSCGGETIYVAEFDDRYMGRFDGLERKRFLQYIADAILEKINKEKQNPLKLKQLMDLYDNWNGETVINNDKLKPIIIADTHKIMKIRPDLCSREVVSFGFYDNQFTVRVKGE